MAAFFDDKPLVAGVNEDWDEHTTGTQIMRPDWDFSPIRMRTMHHLPQIFFDTLRPEGQTAQCLYLVVSQGRATELYPWIYIVMNHVVYRQEISCQPNKRRCA